MTVRTSPLIISLLLPLFSACGEQTAVEPSGALVPGFDLPVPAEVDAPDEVHFHVVTEDREVVDLDWWTSCLSFPSKGDAGVMAGTCADGAPPADPVSVGGPEEVPLAFDLPRWQFREATFRPHGDPAAEDAPTTRIERTGQRTFVVRPPDEPGDYDVEVFGRGPEGDAVTTFRWVVR